MWFRETSKGAWGMRPRLLASGYPERSLSGFFAGNVRSFTNSEKRVKLAWGSSLLDTQCGTTAAPAQTIKKFKEADVDDHRENE